jgi:hypothetical protein
MGGGGGRACLFEKKKKSETKKPSSAIGNLPVFYPSIVGSIAMTDFDMGLSSAAMNNIVMGKIQEDFAFVVGGEGYKFLRILAEFLSSES